MIRIKSLILVFFSALLCLSCVPDLEVKVEFNEPDYEMSVGDTLDLNAELTVENSVEAPKFTAPDETVGKFVSAGVFVAVAPGEVEITANVAGKSATTKVHGTVLLPRLSLTTTTILILSGLSLQVRALSALNTKRFRLLNISSRWQRLRTELRSM